MYGIIRTLERNLTASTKTSNSKVMMLQYWTKTLKQSKELPILRDVVRETELTEIEETYLKIKEYDQSEDRKRSMNSNSNKSDKSHSYRSGAQPRSKTFNSAGEPKADNTHSYRTEDLHRPKTLQDEDLLTLDELNASTLPPVEGTQGINSFLQNAFQTLIPPIFRALKSVRHVVILMAILTQAACKDDQVSINCTSAAEITSPNYPATYPPYHNKNWFVDAPEGRMILLTFNNFSLGPLDELDVIDTIDVGYRQRYSGEESPVPPFLSGRNSLVLRFTSDGNPTRNGFNISASCYDLSGTRVGRLVDGNTPAEGFLELQAESRGEWMRVCEDPSADRLADVVCGELGFPGAKEVSYEQGGCSLEGAYPDCMRAPSCGNYAYRSQDCSASSAKCTSSLAVKVKCFEPGYKGCHDLGNTQLKNGSSYETTSQCITSCRGDTSQAIAITNGSECFCSTTDDIGLSYYIFVKDPSCALHQLVYNATVGFCNQMDGVMHGSWDSGITWFGSIVRLTCDDGYRLIGSGTLQCVTAVSSNLYVWNGSIPKCKMVTDIDTSTSLSIERDSADIPTPSIVTAILFSILCVLLSVLNGTE